MHTKLAVMLACVVMGVVAVLWLWPFAESGGEVSKAPGPVPTVVLPKSKIGFRYDTVLYLFAKAGESLASDSVIPPCDESFEYCIYRTSEGYAGTNFSTAGLRITQRTDLTEEEACTGTEPAGYSGLAVKRRGGEGYSVSVFGPRTGAAAGQRSFSAVYRLFTKGYCYEFEARVAESQFENYPAGTIERFTSAEREIVYSGLVDILTTTSREGSSVPIVYPSLD